MLLGKLVLIVVMIMFSSLVVGCDVLEGKKLGNAERDAISQEESGQTNNDESFTTWDLITSISVEQSEKISDLSELHYHIIRDAYTKVNEDGETNVLDQPNMTKEDWEAIPFDIIKEAVRDLINQSEGPIKKDMENMYLLVSHAEENHEFESFQMAQKILHDLDHLMNGTGEGFFGISYAIYGSEEAHQYLQEQGVP